MVPPSLKQIERGFPVRAPHLSLAATVTAIVAAVAILAAGPASAIDDVVIPIDSVAFGDEGEIIEVASVTVEPELVGSTCSLELEADNNGSVHPDNDLIVTTGGQSGTIPDVESEPGQVTIVDEDVVLGETVVVELQFGPDGVTSGGLILTFDCEAQPVPTTTAPPTTTEPPTTTLPPTGVDPAVEGQPTFTG